MSIQSNAWLVSAVELAGYMEKGSLLLDNYTSHSPVSTNDKVDREARAMVSQHRLLDKALVGKVGGVREAVEALDSTSKISGFVPDNYHHAAAFILGVPYALVVTIDFADKLLVTLGPGDKVKKVCDLLRRGLSNDP